MAGRGKSLTNAKKLERYERVVAIVNDRMALEAHMQERKATSQEIRFMREDAYCNIVQAIMDSKAVFASIQPELHKASRRRSAPKADAIDSRRK